MAVSIKDVPVKGSATAAPHVETLKWQLQLLQQATVERDRRIAALEQKINLAALRTSPGSDADDLSTYAGSRSSTSISRGRPSSADHSWAASAMQDARVTSCPPPAEGERMEGATSFFQMGKGQLAMPHRPMAVPQEGFRTALVSGVPPVAEEQPLRLEGLLEEGDGLCKQHQALLAEAERLLLGLCSMEKASCHLADRNRQMLAAPTGGSPSTGPAGPPGASGGSGSCLDVGALALQVAQQAEVARAFRASLVAGRREALLLGWGAPAKEPSFLSQEEAWEALD